VKATELLEFLREFYRDKLTNRQAHVVSARVVPDYNFNNTYQYVIAREDVQLNWLRDAITDMGGVLDEVAEPSVQAAGKPADVEAAVIKRDSESAQAFVQKWRPRVETLPHARYRTLLKVIIGEALEHRRFFEQALAGRADLLGRRPDGQGTGNGVLGVRWIEQ
jgi:hypothetical protein